LNERAGRILALVETTLPMEITRDLDIVGCFADPDDYIDAMLAALRA